MTSIRQQQVNRQNAAKSTGPKSRSGKARIAKNATRHGLTKRPGAEQILAWYRLILNDPKAEIDQMEPEPIFSAATRLAEAEAHLVNVKDAERRFSPDSVFADQRSADGLNTDVDALIIEPKARIEVWDWTSGRFALNKEIERQDIIRQKRTMRKRRRRLLGRYRNEAEAKRRRVFNDWISLCETSKDEIQKQSQ